MPKKAILAHKWGFERSLMMRHPKAVLPLDFYQRDDVVLIARELLGKHLFSMIDGTLTGGIIVETEAYRGPDDKACHAYNGRRTQRTEVMFCEGGIAYVYLCYGIHNLLNIVTSIENQPQAVLIRAIQPTHGIEQMLKRRNKLKKDITLTNGPGALCQALAVTRKLNGHWFNQSPLWIEETDLAIKPSMISTTKRIGVDYAAEDALRPWRFVLDIL
jgi:DNA-3-methyladenine glycosylase